MAIARAIIVVIVVVVRVENFGWVKAVPEGLALLLRNVPPKEDKKRWRGLRHDKTLLWNLEEIHF